MTYKGTVRNNVIVLDDPLTLPEGTTVEVRTMEPRVIETASPDREAVFQALMKRRAANAGLRINMAELIEEEKLDQEERVDQWLSPDR